MLLSPSQRQTLCGSCHLQPCSDPETAKSLRAVTVQGPPTSNVLSKCCQGAGCMCMHTCTNVSGCARLYTCMCLQTCAYVFAHVLLCAHVFVYMRACVFHIVSQKILSKPLQKGVCDCSHQQGEMNTRHVKGIFSSFSALLQIQL